MRQITKINYGKGGGWICVCGGGGNHYNRASNIGSVNFINPKKITHRKSNQNYN